jgi:hypothetical protein
VNAVNDPRLPAAACTNIHCYNYVTLFVAPRRVCTFNELQHPSCLLYLHSTAHHWLRSFKTTPDMNVLDAAIAMEEWLKTADAEDNIIIAN